MVDPEKDPNYQLYWNDRKESMRMWTALTAAFAAFAVIAAFLYVYDIGVTQLASNEVAPPAMSIPAAMPQ